MSAILQEKPRWPRAVAHQVVDELARVLRPASQRLAVAGSYRRGKETVGDVEILYVPQFVCRKSEDFFEEEWVNLVEEAVTALLSDGTLRKRSSTKGTFAWGPLNKLAVHVATGIPVDLFAANHDNWWNYLVCRTGPKESNTRIAMAAQARGWKWNPYGNGFTHMRSGSNTTSKSEEDVFQFVGLPYLLPSERF